MAFAAPDPPVPDPPVPDPRGPGEGGHDRGSYSARLERIFSGSSGRYAAIGATAVVTIVVLVLAAGLGGRTGNGTAAKAAAVTAAPPASVVPTSTPAPSTTAPIQAAPVVARSGTGATISVRSPFQITLHTSGTCWVQVTDRAGQTLFTATLHSGQEQLIPGATPIVVRLGYTPAMSISVDGVGIDLRGLSDQNLNSDRVSPELPVPREP